MSQVVGQLMIEMAANVARLQTDMAKATKTVDGAMASIVKSVDIAKKAFIGLVSAEAISKMVQAGKAAIDMADSLDELAEKTGVSVEQLSGLRVAFDLNALQADQVGAVMKKLSISVAKGADAFGAMGIQVKNADGTLKSTDRILLEIADKFAGYKDGANKAALAVDIFGKSGADMIPVLNQGAAGLQSFIDKAKEFNILIDKDTAAAAGNFNDQIKILQIMSQGLWVQLSSQLLPILLSITEGLRQAENETNVLKFSMDSLANSLKVVYSMFLGISSAAILVKNIGTGLTDIIQARITGGSDARAAKAAEVRAKIAEDLRISGEQLANVWNTTSQAVDRATEAAIKTADQMAKKVAPEIKTVTDATKKQGIAAKTAAIETRDYNDAHVATYKAYVKAIKSAEDMIAQIEFETKTLKMSNLEREQAIALRELERDGLDVTSDAYKRYAERVKAAISGREAVQAAINEQQKAKEYWDRLWQDVGQSLTDQLMQGGMNAKQLLEGTFRSMVLRPTIEAAVNASIQNVTGTAAGQSIAQSAAGQTIGTILGPAVIAAAAAGIWKDLGRRISGGRDIGGGAIGEGLDFMFGGTLSRMFGRGPQRVQSSTVSGTLGAGGADLLSQVLTKQRGGIFSSNKYRTYTAQIAGETDAILDAQVQAIRAQVINASKALGMYSDAMGQFTQSINLDMKDLTDEQRQKALQDALAGFGDAFAAYASSGVAQSLEDLVVAANNFTAVNNAFNMLGYTAIKAEESTIKMTNALVDAFGGIESFTRQTNYFFDNFYSKTEQNAYNERFLTTELAKLGKQLPLTREEFKNMVNSIDLMTESGQHAYATLLNLAPQMDQYISTLESAAQVAAEAQAKLLEEQQRAYDQAQADLLQQIQTNNSEIERINKELADYAQADAKRIADAIMQALDDSVKYAEQFSITLSRNINSYTQNFFNETEKTAISLARLANQFKAINQTMPSSREGFMALVNAQDLTTASGRAAYAAILDLQDEFAALVPAVDNVTDAFAELISTLKNTAMDQLDAQIKASSDAGKAARASAQDYAEAAKSIRQVSDELYLAALGQKESLAFLSSQYNALLARARSGDIEAMKQVSGAAQAVLGASAGMAITRADFIKQTVLIQNQLNEAAAVAEVQQKAADYQALLYETNAALLELTKDNLSQQNVNQDLLRAQLYALDNLTASIVASANMTVRAYADGASGIKVGLFDSAGNVVAGLNATTALQLQAMASETDFQIKRFDNATIGQTTAFGGFSQAQVKELQNVDSKTATTISVTDLVAKSTKASEGLLVAMLSSMGQVSAGTQSISNAIASGNAQLANSIYALIGSIQQQQQAQFAAEYERQKIEQFRITQQIEAETQARNQALAAQYLAEQQAETERQRRLAEQQAAEQRRQQELQAQAAAAEAERQRLLDQQRALEEQRQAEIRRKQEAEAAAAAAAAAAAEAARQQAEMEAIAAKKLALAEQARKDEINLANFFMYLVRNRLQELVGGPAGGIQTRQQFEEAVRSGMEIGALFGAKDLVIEINKLAQDMQTLRNQVLNLGGVPAFADGGMHAGGLRLVGENGPELQVTGPARIYNAQQTAGMLAGGVGMIEELRLLRQEVNELRFEARATATNTNKTQRLLERVTLDGEAMQTVAYS